jgi:putative endonuclease
MRRSYEGSPRGWCAQRLDAVTNSLRFARGRGAEGAQPPGMTYARQRLGRRAEELVATGLRRSGWRIVARNERLPSGELDIVAMDGGTLVFVEVKAGRAGAIRGPELPAHAVGRRKQLKLRRLAREWIAERRGPSGVAGYRFDVVGVRFGPDGLADVDHIRAAF